MTREEATDTLVANYPDRCYELLREAVDVAIEALKQSERKKGRWMMNSGIGTICSNCYYKLETTGLLLYCPNCGAYMRGEEK